ncbi:MAG TPA: zf-HC2 domain-containing protein, partial [Pyrinomonadaceae bacterium]
MKFESDTEIDRLLRRQARRKAPVAASARDAAASDEANGGMSASVGRHLDADELNAYAEGALPEGARSRYFAHLADCDECRGLVTRLTLAAGGAAAAGKHVGEAAAPGSRSWREWLAAFFAPSVLRYAVPALALLAVMIVAWVATRERRSVDLVAQNEQRSNANTSTSQSGNEQLPEHGTVAQSNSATTGTAAVDESAQRNANAGNSSFDRGEAGAAATPAQRKDAELASKTTAQQNNPKPSDQPNNDVLADARTGDRDATSTVAKAQQQPAPPPVASVPATKAPVEDDEYAKEEPAKKSDRKANAADKNKVAGPEPDASAGGFIFGGGRTESRVNEKRAPEASRRARAERGGQANEVQLSRAPAGVSGKDERETETREVGGRRFRRQGGAWVDTAYSSSRATVNVTRGSE